MQKEMTNKIIITLKVSEFYEATSYIYVLSVEHVAHF